VGLAVIYFLRLRVWSLVSTRDTTPRSAAALVAHAGCCRVTSNAAPERAVTSVAGRGGRHLDRWLALGTMAAFALPR